MKKRELAVSLILERRLDRVGRIAVPCSSDYAQVLAGQNEQLAGTRAVPPSLQSSSFPGARLYMISCYFLSRHAEVFPA